MDFRDSLKRVLPKDLYTQVEEAVGEEFEWGNDLIPKGRFNAVIEQRNSARSVLEKLTGTKAPDDDELQATLDKINKKPETSGPDIEELTRKHQEELGTLKMQFAATETLREFGVLDPNLLWESSLLDKSKIKLENGKLAGLSDQLESLKKDKTFLFGETGGGAGTGRTGGAPFETVKSKADFLNLSTEDQISFKKQNPAAFTSFLGS